MAIGVAGDRPNSEQINTEYIIMKENINTAAVCMAEKDKAGITYRDASSIRQDHERVLLSKRDLERFQKSIRENGFLNPLTVTADGELVDGRKRLCAAYCLDMPLVPCVSDTSGYISTDKKIIHNILYENGDCFTAAAAISELIERHLMTQDAVASALGVSQSYVANKLRLLKFDSDERRFILENGLSERHARAFLKLKDPYVRKEAMKYTADGNLTVSAAESYIDTLAVNTTPGPQSSVGAMRHACKAIDKAVSAAENLGIPVTLRRFDDCGCVCYSIRLKR